MSRILLSLLAVLSLAAILPAGAEATDYCVGDPACVAAGGTDMGSDGNALQAALDAAKAHVNVGGADRVLVGAGTYSRANGANPAFRYTGDDVVIRGAGAQATTLTRDTVSSATVLYGGTGATVRDLTIRIPGGSGMYGLTLTGATADGVTITTADGVSTPTGVDVNVGGVFKNGSAKLSGGTGASLADGATLSGSTVGGTFAVQAGGGTVTVSRCRILAGAFGILAYYPAGLTVENTLVDLGGGGGTGIRSAANINGDATAALRHLTIVHGSSAAKGLSLQANNGRTSTATLEDSVIDGVGHALDLEGDGAGSAVSLTTRSSLAPTTGMVTTNTNGAPVPTLTAIDAITAAPGFVSTAGDWHLRFDSPLVDAGTPGALGVGESTADLDGLPRLVGGRRDVGAFEYQRRAPVVTAGASAATAVAGEALTFTGTASDADPGDVVTAYQWTFDDGAVVPAGAVTAHAFATAGPHVATLTARDSAGVTGSATVTVIVGEAPPTAGPPAPVGAGAGGGGTPPPAAGPTKPARILALSIAPAGLRPGQRGLVRYRLSAPGTVTLRVERAARGHRRSGRCRAGGRGRACTRWVRMRGSVRHAGAAGANRVRLPARFGGRKLKPGRYRIVARVGRADPVRILFRVLR